MQIEQILMNLAANARDACPRGAVHDETLMWPHEDMFATRTPLSRRALRGDDGDRHRAAGISPGSFAAHF